MFTLSSVSSILDSRTVVLTIFNIPPATVSHKIMGQQIAGLLSQTHSINLWIFIVRIRVEWILIWVFIELMPNPTYLRISKVSIRNAEVSAA